MVHRVRPTSYFDKKLNPLVSDDKFWILTDAVRAFITSVDLCFCLVQEISTLVASRSSRFESHLSAFKADISIECPLFCIDLLMVLGQYDMI